MCGRKELSTTTGSPIGYHILGVPYTVHHPSHQTLHFPKQLPVNETYNDGYQSNQFIARRRDGHHCRIRIDISCHIIDLDIEILLLVRRRVNQSPVMCELYESREQTVPAMKLTRVHVYIYLFLYSNVSWVISNKVQPHRLTRRTAVTTCLQYMTFSSGPVVAIMVVARIRQVQTPPRSIQSYHFPPRCEASFWKKYCSMRYVHDTVGSVDRVDVLTQNHSIHHTFASCLDCQSQRRFILTKHVIAMILKRVLVLKASR